MRLVCLDHALDQIVGLDHAKLFSITTPTLELSSVLAFMRQ
jgi:hypothetical protein